MGRPSTVRQRKRVIDMPTFITSATSDHVVCGQRCRDIVTKNARRMPGKDAPPTQFQSAADTVSVIG